MERRFAAGKVGQSFLLDGSNAYVVIPDSPSLRPASVTVEAWVKIFSTNGTQLVFEKPIGSGTLDSYGLALVNGVPIGGDLRRERIWHLSFKRRSAGAGSVVSSCVFF